MASVKTRAAFGAASTALNKGGEEGCQLAARLGKPAGLPEVNRQFVEQDERRLVAEQRTQRVGAGSYTLFVAAAYPLIARLASQGVRDLAPRGVCQHATRKSSAVRWIGALSVEGGDTDRPGGQQRRIDELADVRHTVHPARSMSQRNQAVRLAAAVRRVETEDRSHRVASAAEAATDVGEEVPETAGRVRVGEEQTGLAVPGGSRGQSGPRRDQPRSRRPPPCRRVHRGLGLQVSKIVGIGTCVSRRSRHGGRHEEAAARQAVFGQNMRSRNMSKSTAASSTEAIAPLVAPGEDETDLCLTSG